MSIRSVGPRGAGALVALVAWACAPRIALAQSDTAAAAPRVVRRRPPPTAGDERVATVHASGVRDRTASEYLVPAARFDVVPRANAGDVVALAPGAWVSQDNGEGHAQHVYLRGFFSEDGSDLAFSVDGVPLNQVGHPEHHGLVELATIIPELIQRVDATAGVADPRQGDFAVAGSVDLHLGLHDRGFVGRTTVGSFGYARFLALWGPRGMGEDTFVGTEFVRGDGFGPARAFHHATAMGQLGLRLPGGAVVRVLANVFSTRFQAPGPVRQDDVASGQIDFFGAYPLDAQGLGGGTDGALGSVAFESVRALQRIEARVYAMARNTTLTEDFTGYLVHPVDGDRTHYGYAVGTIGSNGLYRRSVLLGGRAQDLEVGWTVRFDRFFASARSVDAQNQPLQPADPDDRAASSGVLAGGSYADLVVRPLAWLTLRGGGRVDFASYDATVSTFGAAAGPGSARVVASGVRAGPKATVDLHLGQGFSVLASYGSGFRSPDPLEVATGAPFAFTNVSGQDVGLRWAAPPRLIPAVQLIATLTAFHTYVDNDITFDPTSGTEVTIGPTDRLGGALWGRLRWRGLDVNAAVTYTRALAEQDALDGRVRAGLPLPNLPALVARVDAALDQPVGTVRGVPLRIRAGLSAGVRSAPPLVTVAGFPTFLLDAALGARLGPVALDLAARNLPDFRTRDSQFEYPSSFTQGAPASMTPALHFTAGAPRTLLLTATIYL